MADNPNSVFVSPSPAELHAAVSALQDSANAFESVARADIGQLVQLGEQLKGGGHFELAAKLFSACCARLPDSPHFVLAALTCRLRAGQPVAEEDENRLQSIAPDFLKYFSALRLSLLPSADAKAVLSTMQSCFEAFLSGSEADWLYLTAAQFMFGDIQKGRTSEREIPGRLFFYWDKDPPPEIRDNIAYHQNASGLQVTLCTRDMAIEFLDAYYGRDSRNLFLGLRHPAEESDFIRYHLIHTFGGYYLDLDERLIAPNLLKSYAEGTDAFLVRSNTGPLENSLFGGVAGSCVTEEALHVLLHNCYAHANDSIWLKSGPGVLTRAVVRLYHRAFIEMQPLPSFRVMPDRVYGDLLLGLDVSYRNDARDWRVFEAEQAAKSTSAVSD